MSVYSKLTVVQAKLKAPKNQFNKFGNYKYRSCEDILEALKPVLNEEKATVFISDSIERIESRYYVKATATFIDSETGETVSNTAYAREPENKKGSDESQITGASSSYARKYALNGLFLIDDTKDEDTEERQNEKKNRANKAEKKPETAEVKTDDQKNAEMVAGVNPLLLPDGKGMTKERMDFLHQEIERTGINNSVLLGFAKVQKYEDMNEATYIALMNKLAITKDKDKR